MRMFTNFTHFMPTQHNHVVASASVFDLCIADKYTMGRGSWIAVMALMAVVVASCAGAAQADYTAPSFVVNLDEEAGMRWDATVKGILEKYGYHSSFGAIMRYVDSLIPAPIIDLLEPLLAGLVKDLGEYGQEVRSCTYINVPLRQRSHSRIACLVVCTHRWRDCTTLLSSTTHKRKPTTLHWARL